MVGIDFGVLGPFTARVDDDGSSIQLGALKPFRVLGLLLLRPGQSRSAEGMISEVWGPDTDPRSGHDSLKSAVAQLNRWFRAHTGQPQVSHVRPDGYVLDRGVGADNLRFRQLVERRPAEAEPDDEADHEAEPAPDAGRTRLVEALALWRGPRAWPGFEDVPSLAADAAQLEELRHDALHTRIDVDLRLGRHRRVIAELEALLHVQPEREDFCAQLMVALYRSGRQRDALAAYARTVSALEELGFQPGRALVRMERDILVQDPALDLRRPAGSAASAGAPAVSSSAPASSPPPAPPMPLGAGGGLFAAASLPPNPAGPFVGRDEAVERMAARLDADAGGPDRLTALSGPAGVGKTRLLAELAARAGQRGATVLHGWCDPELDLPYQPIAELLRAWVSAVALDELRAVVGGHGPDLARLVPDLAARLGLPARPAGGDERDERHDGDGARYRLFDGFWSLLAAIGADAPPALVVIDDVHWADFGTCQLLRYVVRRGLAPAVRLVLAGRTDGDVARPGARLLDEVGRGLPGRREPLAALDEADTVALVRRLAPPAWGEVNWALGRRIHQLTAGLPFAVRALVDASPTPARVDELVEAALDVGVALTWRIAQLPPPTRELLQVAAVHGPIFDAGELAELAERPVDDVVADLEPARAIGVVVDLPARPDVYQFDHELGRRALLRRMTAGRRARIEARLAEQAVARGAPAVQVARRRCAAVPVVPVADAFREATTAGQVALEAARYEEAATLLETAVALADAHPYEGIEPMEVVQGLVALARALEYEGDASRALVTARRALEEARELGSADWMARAALVFDVHRGPTIGAGDQLALLDEAHAALDDEVDAHLAARVELERTWAAVVLGRDVPDVAALDRVAETAARLDAPDLDFHATVLRCSTHFDPTGRSWRTNLARMEAIAHRMGDHRGLLVAASTGFVVQLALGDPAGAEAALARQERLNEALGQPWHRWNAAKQRVCLQLARGQLDAARPAMDDVRQLGDRYEIADAGVAYAVQLFVWSWHQGSVGALADGLAVAAAAQPSNTGWRGGLGVALLERGDRPAALEQLAAAVGALGRGGFDPFRGVGLAMTLELAARLDQPDGVAPLLAELEAGAGQLVVIGAGVATLGPVDRYLGLGAAVLGRPGEAKDRLQAAVGQAERLGLRPWAAMARSDLARWCPGAEPAPAPHSSSPG